nr:MDIS1-interacting receptor like kinase 2-like [Ziziphus jujuba var. spinosa]
MPVPLEQCSKLRELYLGENIFSGITHFQIASVHSLQYMDLSRNMLTGVLPTELGNFILLETINLSHNKLSGALPSTFQQLISLTSVDVSYNELKGPLPNIKAFTEASIKALERGSLETILIDNVKAVELEWSKRLNVVKGLANAISYMHYECCPAIIHRDIASKDVLLDNEYEAHISDFGSAISLDPNTSKWTPFVGIFGYAATVEVNEKCDMYCFGVVILEMIMGKHPRELIFSIDIVIINTSCSSNSAKRFIGSTSLASKKWKLTWFTAYGNYFKGSIPQSMRNCTTLFRVDLQGNDLTGNISKQFGVYQDLGYMDLSNNNFFGRLTGNWGQCPKLTVLRIYDNMVSGMLPPEVGRATQLHILDLSYNLLVGKFLRNWDV